jgi:hypothetical protein
MSIGDEIEEQLIGLAGEMYGSILREQELFFGIEIEIAEAIHRSGP